jgi:hypothetical protein
MNSRLASQPGLKFVFCNRPLPFLGVLALTCLLALFSQPAAAQVAFGSMVGNVTDATGGSIPGASVKITLTSTNDSRTVPTDAAGAYTISTVTPGTYRVEVTKAGFRTFIVDNILVNQNNVVRVDAQLPVGALSEKIEVTTTAVAELQTERADVHAEVSTMALLELPQPNRTYEGLLELVPGTAPPAGQLSGGTNNPSKSMTFAFNGTGTAGGAVRIEGINAINPWNTSAQSVVPSVEAIQNVNVATNATDAEQGLAGGASVNVMLKSGTNETHGGVYEYNSDSAFEANNFFSNAANMKKPPLLVDNNLGGFAGGHILRNKLFYFGSYEGDFAHSANSGVLSLPNGAMLGGNLSGSPTPIYDPTTGTATGASRTPFPGNIIPISRFDPVSLRIIPNIPPTNVGGATAVTNNFYINDANVYNLHKIDSKLDWNVNSKFRLSGRFAYQPYYDYQQPIYGETLGGSSAFSTAGAGNYKQNGAGLAVSGSGSYVISPTFVIDASWGKTSTHQILMPNLADTRYGLDVLKIPGTNNGPLPWTGGVPNFAISNFVTMGASYPALEYIQPIYEYTANATKIKGSHTIRFGADLSFQHPRHIEDRNNTFTFNGGITTMLGGSGANAYNALADFMLGAFYEGTNWLQVLQPYLTMRTWEEAIYVRDQWHVSPKLTLNYGVRWEKYPLPTRDASMNAPNPVAPSGLGSTGNGLYFLDMQHATVSVCGAGGIPSDCGISVSNKLISPSIGIAYRPMEKFVIRAGYSLSPTQANMGMPQMQAYPGEVQLDQVAVNPYTPVGHLVTGLPQILAAPGTNSVYPILPNTGNLTAVNSQKKFVRGYYESYNITLQRELLFGMLGSLGYVGTHGVHLLSSVGLNYGQLGGGTASQPLAWLPDYSTGITSPLPWGHDKYNSLQAQLNKRLSSGLQFQAAYTYSKDIGMATSILIPQYTYRDYYTTSLDRTHHIVVSAAYELPFGKGKSMATSGVGAAVLGGWSVNGIFNHYSGTMFTVSASSSSCNCPGNSQTANLIAAGKVAKVGNGVDGLNATATSLQDAYLNPLAYAPVTGAVFGTAGFDQVRGPGNNNMDMSVFRTFRFTERYKLQIRAESMNITNTPHFNNPSGTNVSNMSLNADGTLKNLGGFMQITTTNPLGRLLDQRYFRFGFRILF